ncbi:F-box/LRR-repeat protein 17 [Lethenteron reissneri]|uniref:F-box/LRR-repeat protein 17 n=1 Tax=Lethenteron reissneri TaxID=7753 RepID=UPI002AB6E1B8|nr:F-box/LRR-repeat protein 17 [Lethenteron reissneri]
MGLLLSRPAALLKSRKEARLRAPAPRPGLADPYCRGPRSCCGGFVPCPAPLGETESEEEEEGASGEPCAAHAEMPLAGGKRKCNSTSNTNGGDDPGSLPSSKLPCLSPAPVDGVGPAADGHVAAATVPAEAANINRLPSSILLKVLSYLSLMERCLAASLVCRLWRELCSDPELWRRLDLSGRQKVTDEVLAHVTSLSHGVTRVCVADCRAISDAGVALMARSCPALLCFSATRCKQLTDGAVGSLARHCPALRSLNLSNLDAITDDALRQLGASCSDLREVHLGQCYLLTDAGITALARGCPLLTKIYLLENHLVTNSSVQCLAECCPRLQYVGLMGCSVTSRGVRHLARLGELVTLDLRHVSELDGETVMALVRSCSRLTTLNLCLNRGIDDRCVEVIAKEGRNIKELYLVSCSITDQALLVIGRFSASIETVDVGWCQEITDHGAIEISRTSRSLAYLGLMRCDKVSEDTVEELVQRYPRIVYSTMLQDCKRTLARAYQLGWKPSGSAGSAP